MKVSSVPKSERGLTGIVNIGNTCFMNSVIQCLSNTKPLLEYILNQQYENESKELRSQLMKRFAELIQNMWNDQKGAVSAHSVKSALSIYTYRFIGNNQHDAQEFLRYLLEGLHKDINRVSGQTNNTEDSGRKMESEPLGAEETWQRYLKIDNSKIVDTFGGLLRSVLKCKTCGYSSTVYEPFWDLSLPVPNVSSLSFHQTLTLSHCLDLFTQEETLDGLEKPTCSRCKTKQTCSKRISIQKFPQVLVIHLKRFTNGGLSQKVENYIDFPILNLDMSAYSADARLQNTVYDLYGVVSHYGSTQFGHYTATCKHPFSGEWHRFNDKSVVAITEDRTDKSSAYILFYLASS